MFSSLVKSDCNQAAQSSFKFKYSPLNSEEFRLLFLLPPDEESPVIKCRISNHQLENPPEYEALSYTWNYEVKSKPRTIRRGNKLYMIISENESGPQNILLDGQNFAVTNNLYHALKRLCAGITIPRALWTDQICINQEDVDERGSQVAQMRRIYAQAEQVIVWLGRHDQLSERAMPFLPHFTAALEQEGWAFSEFGLQAKLKDDDFHAHVATLHFLLDRAWWHRVWVIQEVALAKQAVVCCGSDFYPYSDFARLIHAMLNGRVRSLLGRDGIPPNTLQVLVLLLTSCRDAASLGQLRVEQVCGERTSLSSALKHTKNFHATDPRDKVFSLLGLTPENPMQPNYRLTTVQVYSNAVTCMLKEDGDLRAFCWLGNVEDRDPDWPSWVPDFTKFQEGSSISHRFEWKGSTRIYNASGTTENNPMTFNIREEGKVLALTGLCVDIIAELGDESPGPSVASAGLSGDLPSLGDVLPSWKQVAGLLDGEVENSRLQAFWRAVLADQGIEDFDLNGEQDHSDLAAEYIGASRLPKVTPSFPPSEELEKKIIATLDHHPGPQYSRKFFVTENGRMGIGPQAARKGDVIYVLLGGEVPYLLRPDSEGRHEMLGEWYVLTASLSSQNH